MLTVEGAWKGIQITSDGKRAIASNWNGKVKSVDCSTKKVIATLYEAPSEEEYINKLAFISPDRIVFGQVYNDAEVATAQVWKINEDFTKIEFLKDLCETPYKQRISLTEKYIAVPYSDRKHLYLYDLEKYEF